jgi:hypothetical protein
MTRASQHGMRVVVRKDELAIGRWFGVTFERTLRIPDDCRTYPLPPGLGPLPIQRIRGELTIPMYQREALWLMFEGKTWHPCAVQIGIGGINAVSGGDWTAGLTAEPQNYVVCPDQPWLDGINVGPGIIRQFVAVPLGSMQTVEGQLTGREATGGMQIRVYAAKPGRFPERPPRATFIDKPQRMRVDAMGLGAGGRMRQKIYPDQYGLDTWDPTQSGSVSVRIVNSADYTKLSGHLAPPTPVDAQTYTAAGLPWYDLYDADRGDVEASARLAGVRSVGDLEQATDDSVEIGPRQVETLHGPSRTRRLPPRT